MAKAKKEAPPKKGCPAWQGTFGDLMNLLLCFFVLLFSMSTLDAAKYEEVAASFSAAFGIFDGGQNALGDGALIGDGVSQLSSLSAYTTSMGASASGDADETTDATSGEDVSEGGPDVSEAEATLEAAQMEASEQLAKEVTEALQAGMTEEEKAELTEEEVISDVILNYTSQYVQLTISGSLLFASGSAQLQESAYPVLDKVGAVLESYAGGTIEIEGHTDNVPISNAMFANNDELSDARALSVFYYILDVTELDPANIKHSGRGEYVPVADNTTAEGRAKNRRVEIRIYNPLSSSY
ncbi:chemotaxis protein MotB [Butyrivibrio fibrisolvens DSM 3071]|uniref:Chemotaxis protein MotB n=1 Tax=Butyrivibrio fibrisolvens DSM 3071 TaxID=1121131 RepID=A0A1M5YU53_BUTFI|nr:flagellar motor protein MotB [Butyrivibrio fibrisolvens]SHI15505.1 chemotaxis protein MotB [Butyrivibrio fibrisolvens DSM 3071]